MSTMTNPNRFRTTRVMTKLLDIHDLQALFKLRRGATYRLTHEPDFPAPVKLSATCYRWEEEAIAKFLASRTQAEPIVAGPVAVVERKIVGTPRSRHRGRGAK